MAWELDEIGGCTGARRGRGGAAGSSTRSRAAREFHETSGGAGARRGRQIRSWSKPQQLDLAIMALVTLMPPVPRGSAGESSSRRRRSTPSQYHLPASSPHPGMEASPSGRSGGAGRRGGARRRPAGA
ncbi:hypothetical protein E2562_016937 [Oryza meyeriana var. granulata]|uniref:Uncharacterized protein n=1 Tax=Oryza meyeriana var. granulata TaxID=110450 RepID=A0A6G1DXK8_9ORYZ|nr:hypothetical protein E2562_016937 [Oryza meyeriana var. granulata]